MVFATLMKATSHMSAFEYLNRTQIGPLFHGTSEPLNPRARKIRSFKQADFGYRYNNVNPYEGRRLAFATTNYDLAKSHGIHVYEVMPDEYTQYGVGKDVYISEKGFGIVRKLPDEELTQRNLISLVRHMQTRPGPRSPLPRTTDIREHSFNALGAQWSPHGSLNMHLYENGDEV